MPVLISLQCCVCNKTFTRNKTKHLYSLKTRGHKKICCSPPCARQSKRKPEGTKRRQRSLKTKERCFKCNEFAIKIIHTSVNDLSHRLRRKECTNCNYRFTTYEVSKEDYENFTNKKPLCNECPQNTGSKCGLDLPEYMTQEAYDCVHCNNSDYVNLGRNIGRDISRQD
jgi:hypothetical protein